MHRLNTDAAGQRSRTGSDGMRSDSEPSLDAAVSLVNRPFSHNALQHAEVKQGGRFLQREETERKISTKGALEFL